MRQHQSGFSLVELLIVVAVIGIISAIAIPSVIEAQKRAREGSAVGCIRSYTSAQYTFNATTGRYRRYGTQAELAAGFLDPELMTTGVRNRYVFTFALGPGLTTFSVNADPQSAISGDTHYFSDVSAVIRFAEGAPADAMSQPIN